MYYRDVPRVIASTPENLASGVPLDAPLKVTFNIDLDRASLDGMVLLQDELGVAVAGTTAYDRRVLTFTPVQPLLPQTTYRLILRGDCKLTDDQPAGIRSILGAALPAEHVILFTTGPAALPAPQGLTPADETLVHGEVSFAWQPVPGARGYEIAVSRSNTLAPLFWPLSPQELPAPQVTPDVLFPDGVFYWRVRAVGADGAPGDWSPVQIFAKDSRRVSPVTPEDSLPPDVDDWQAEPLTVLEVWPEDGFSNVALNLHSIYVRLNRSLTEEELAQAFRVTLTGLESDTPQQVTGTVSGLPQADGTFLAVFTPDPVGGE